MKKIGLYIHIPFCIKKCPYCDFLSFIKKENYFNEYIDTVIKEILLYKKKYNVDFDTLYIGGGTPTIFDPDLLSKFFKKLYKTINKDFLKEITIETNPETLTKEKANVLRDNITRLSIGAQSFDNNFLEVLGRIHTKEKIFESVEIAKTYGIKNINVDIIYGKPGEKTSDIIYDVKEAISLGIMHISMYLLTIYKDTEFFKKDIKLPKDEAVVESYFEIVSILEKNNFFQYEISNFSKKNYECLHNKKYWDMEEYLGVGVSASSYLNNKRWRNTFNLNKYIDDINKNKFPVDFIEEYNFDTYLKDFIMLSLRKKQGINLKDFKEKFNFDFYEKYSNIIEKLKKEELMEYNNNNIFLTKKGMILSNEIIQQFF